MSKTYTLRASLETGTDGTAFTIPSYTLPAGAYAELHIFVRRTGAPTTPTITDGASRTWTLRQDQTLSGVDYKLLMYSTQNAGETTGTTTATFTNTHRYFIGTVTEVTGNVDAAAYVQSAIATGSTAQPTPGATVTLAAFGAAANGTIVGSGYNAAIDLAPESGNTEIFNAAGGEATTMAVSIKDSEDTSAYYGGTADSQIWAIVASEVEEAAAAATARAYAILLA